MPAIHLTRLKQQTAQLSEHFDSPQAFVRGLYDLFEIYSDRTQRPGQSGEPPSIVKTYYAPKPVMRQLMIELQPKIELSPYHALNLVDKLWAEFNLEFCLLAATILGSIPPDPPEIILKRVNSWIDPNLEDRLISLVVERALHKIRMDNPGALLNQIDTWLGYPDSYYQQIGFRASIPLINSGSYENFPFFYAMFAPYTHNAPHKIRPDLIAAIRSLVVRSPKETAYFLRQNLEAGDNPDAAFITRQVIDDFPPELQSSLRSALRAAHPIR